MCNLSEGIEERGIEKESGTEVYMPLKRDR